jgi:hypothetical protein
MGYLKMVKGLYNLLPNSVTNPRTQKLQGNLVGFSWLKNTDDVINYIMNIGTVNRANTITGQTGEKWEIGTKRSYLGAITGVLRRVQGYDVQYKIYGDLHIALITQIEENRKLNKLSDREIKNYRKWDWIQDKWNDFDWNLIKDNDYTKAITAVYLKGELEAPRRLLDYCICVVKHFDDPTAELKRDTETIWETSLNRS